MKGTSTGTLHNHLIVHRDADGVNEFLAEKNASKRKIEIVENEGQPPNKISNYMGEKESMEKIVSRMAVLLRIPFSRFGKSRDCKKYLRSKGHHLNHNGTQLREMILNYAYEERCAMAIAIRQQIDSGHLISLTMDEWTSVANRRYANVNVHVNGIVLNLGLWRCYGAMPAEKCRTILMKIMTAFKLDEPDIVSLTTDAAPVMVKMGKLL